MKIFVPIKENSQRVPRKNFREIEGISLYERLFKKLENFQVFVDTDSEEIIKTLNQKYPNVIAYRRSEKLLGDETSVCLLIENFIKKFNITEEWICQVHVTSPFLREETLKKVQSLSQLEYDSIVSCNPIQTRLWRKEKYGMCPVNHNPVKLEQTQDLPVYYEENSLFYAFRSDMFLETGMRIGRNPFFYESAFPENLDIDTEDDWKLVKKIAESN